MFLRQLLFLSIHGIIVCIEVSTFLSTYHHFSSTYFRINSWSPESCLAIASIFLIIWIYTASQNSQHQNSNKSHSLIDYQRKHNTLPNKFSLIYLFAAFWPLGCLNATILKEIHQKKKKTYLQYMIHHHHWKENFLCIHISVAFHSNCYPQNSHHHIYIFLLLNKLKKIFSFLHQNLIHINSSQ